MQLTVAPDGSALLHIYCMSLTAHVKPAHIHWLLNELLRKVRSHFMRWPLAFWFLLREFPGVSAVCCNCTCYNIRHCALVLMVVWCKSWASLKVFEYFSTTGQFLRQQSSFLATSWPKMPTETCVLTSAFSGMSCNTITIKWPLINHSPEEGFEFL